MFKSKLLNKFNQALFSSGTIGFESATENAKTDYLFDFDNFEDWFNMLIDSFVEEYEVDKDMLIKDISECPEFVDSMRDEYEELLELCSDDEYGDEEV